MFTTRVISEGSSSKGYAHYSIENNFSVGDDE